MTAIPMTVTMAMRMPATITGSASGNSTLQSICRSVRPIPRAASLGAGGAGEGAAAPARGRVGPRRPRVEARPHVADQDEQRVQHERDDRRRPADAQTDDEDHQREHGEAGDRVEEPRDGRQGGVEPPVAGGEYAERYRDDERDGQGDEAQEDVLKEGRHDVLRKVVAQPLPVYEALGLALGGELAPEDRPGGGRRLLGAAIHSRPLRRARGS